MSLPFSNNQIDLLENNGVDLFFLYIDWPEKPIRVWTGVGDVFVMGETWVGINTLGAISSNGAADISQKRRMTLTMTHLPQKYVGLINQNNLRNRSCNLYYGIGDISSGELKIVDDPVHIDQGGIDGVRQTFNKSESQGSRTIEWTVEIDVCPWSGPHQRISHIHSYHDQMDNQDGDTILQYLAKNSRKTTYW